MKFCRQRIAKGMAKPHYSHKRSLPENKYMYFNQYYNLYIQIKYQNTIANIRHITYSKVSLS